MKKVYSKLFLCFLFCLMATTALSVNTASAKLKQLNKSMSATYKKNIYINDTKTFSLENVDDEYTVSFSSSNDDILKISEISDTSCSYTGLSYGTASIKVKLTKPGALFFMKKTKTISYKVSVTPKAVSVRFTISDKKLYPGQSTLLRTTIRPSISEEIPVFSSEDPEIVSIDEDGVITALKPGRVLITATLLNGKKDFCKITVKKPDTKNSND